MNGVTTRVCLAGEAVRPECSLAAPDRRGLPGSPGMPTTSQFPARLQPWDGRGCLALPCLLCRVIPSDGQRWGFSNGEYRPCGRGAVPKLGCCARSSRTSRAICWAGRNVTPPCLGSSVPTSECWQARRAGMQQQGCRAAPGSWHFALLTRYAYCSFFTFPLPLQLILKCSSAVITCCAPAHLHQLPSLAVTSNQHRINCRFAGRKVSLIKHISKGKCALRCIYVALSKRFMWGPGET